MPFADLVDEDTGALDLLSAREREVVELAVEGKTDEQIAQRLGLSTSTVNSYWVRIRGKLGFFSRTEIVSRMLRHEMRIRQADLRAENERLRSDLKRISTDLREAQALNAALKEEAWPFRALLRLPEAILVTAPPASVVFANRQAHCLLGAESGGLEGLRMRELTVAAHEEVREPCREMFQPDGPEREVHGIDRPYYMRRRDGSNFRAVLTAQRFDSPAGPFVALTLREYLSDMDDIFRALRKPLSSA